MYSVEADGLFKSGYSQYPDRRDRARVTVLGLGNILLSDEGIGVHAAATLYHRFTFSPDIEIVDGGTMGLDLLPYFQNRDKILIIDAVDFGRLPGYVGSVEGDGIAAVLNKKLSVHHIGLADLLFAAKLSRETPLELRLVGVQPGSLAIGIDMTTDVLSTMDSIIGLALRKLSEWDIRCYRAGNEVRTPEN